MEELTTKHAWIQTISGKVFYLKEPSYESIDIEDIAHSLSMLCRFNGHTKKFYSVAEHSVLVSLMVQPENAMYGLLHDAPEAYIGDMSSPLKTLFPNFKDLNKSIEAKINFKFGITLTEDKIKDVKNADLRMLITERDQLMSNKVDWPYYKDIQPYDISIKAYDPLVAKNMFLKRFEQLNLKVDVTNTY